MALTLIEALREMPAGNEKDVLQVYAMSYPNLARCPFVDANNGNTHNWTIENNLPASNPRNIGTDFVDDTGDVSPFSETVKLYGGKVKVDEFYTDTMPKAVATQKLMQIKAKGKRAAIDMLEGTGGTNAVGIDGWVAKSGSPWANQTIAVGGATTMDVLDRGVDKVAVMPGSTFFFTTQSQTRAIKKISRNEGSSTTNQSMQYMKDEFGAWAGAYDGIPVIPLIDGKGNDILSGTKFYLVTFGAGMFHGFQNGGLIAKEQNESNWDYFKIKHYMGFNPESVRCFCTFTGVTD